MLAPNETSPGAAAELFTKFATYLFSFLSKPACSKGGLLGRAAAPVLPDPSYCPS
jgi:hypothetical protein